MPNESSSSKKVESAVAERKVTPPTWPPANSAESDDEEVSDLQCQILIHFQESTRNIELDIDQEVVDLTHTRQPKIPDALRGGWFTSVLMNKFAFFRDEQGEIARDALESHQED